MRSFRFGWIVVATVAAIGDGTACATNAGDGGALLPDDLVDASAAETPGSSLLDDARTEAEATDAVQDVSEKDARLDAMPLDGVARNRRCCRGRCEERGERARARGGTVSRPLGNAVREVAHAAHGRGRVLTRLPPARCGAHGAPGMPTSRSIRASLAAQVTAECGQCGTVLKTCQNNCVYVFRAVPGARHVDVQARGVRVRARPVVRGRQGALPRVPVARCRRLGVRVWPMERLHRGGSDCSETGSLFRTTPKWGRFGSADYEISAGHLHGQDARRRPRQERDPHARAP